MTEGDDKRSEAIVNLSQKEKMGRNRTDSWVTTRAKETPEEKLAMLSQGWKITPWNNVDKGGYYTRLSNALTHRSLFTSTPQTS